MRESAQQQLTQKQPGDRQVEITPDELALIRACMVFSARMAMEKMPAAEGAKHVELCKMLVISVNEGRMTHSDAQLIAGALESMIRTLRRDMFLKPPQRDAAIAQARALQTKLDPDRINVR